MKDRFERSEVVKVSELERINQLINDNPNDLLFDHTHGLSNLVIKTQDRNQNSKYILVSEFLGSGDNGSAYIAHPLMLNNGQYEIGTEERIVKKIDGNNFFGIMEQYCGKFCQRQWQYVLDFLDENSTFCTIPQKNLHFIEMVKIPGRSLKGVSGLRSKSIQERVDVFCQLFEQLSVMHGKGIAHKDMTDGNIMYDEKTNCARLFDFDRTGTSDKESYKTITGLQTFPGFGKDIVSLCTIMLQYLHPDRYTHCFESKEEEEIYNFFHSVIKTNYDFAEGKSQTHYKAESICNALKDKLYNMTKDANERVQSVSTIQTLHRFWKFSPDKAQELDANINFSI